YLILRISPISTLFPYTTLFRSIKHIVQLSDPRDSPPSLTIKHLYVALLKIIQVDVVENDEKDRIKETIRRVEKSAAGNKIILEADRKSTRLNSSHLGISYAVFC